MKIKSQRSKTQEGPEAQRRTGTERTALTLCPYAPFLFCILISLALPAAGHTLITVNAGGGADYTSLYDANESLPNPLAGDYEISGAGATDDTTPVLIACRTNGHDLWIHGDWSGGIADEAKYQIHLGSAGTTAITIARPADGVRVDHLQLKGYISGGSRSGHAIYVTTANNVTIHDCYMEDFDDAYSSAGILFYTGGTTGRLAYNNILKNCWYGLSVWQSQGTFYNNTVSGSNGYGMHIQAIDLTVATVKNNLVKGSGLDDYKVDVGGAGSTIVTAKNYTEDATSPDAGCGSATITFVGASDFHLHASMTGTLLGVNLSGIFTTDIDGDTRSSWYTGADELPGGGGGGMPGSTTRRRQSQ